MAGGGFLGALIFQRYSKYTQTPSDMGNKQKQTTTITELSKSLMLKHSYTFYVYPLLKKTAKQSKGAELLITT